MKEKDYVGFIKKTKKGYRAIIATLHDVGEPDGDRTIWEIAQSEMFTEIKDAIVELKSQAIKLQINNLFFTPVTRGQIMWECELK